MAKRRGNCYTTCEALWHLLGGKRSGWRPMVVRHEGDTHWFLSRRIVPGTAPVLMPVQVILDPTRKQFRTDPPYHRARGCGFLTRGPSRRARELMEVMLWQSQDR